MVTAGAGNRRCTPASQVARLIAFPLCARRPRRAAFNDRRLTGAPRDLLVRGPRRAGLTTWFPPRLTPTPPYHRGYRGDGILAAQPIARGQRRLAARGGHHRACLLRHWKDLISVSVVAVTIFAAAYVLIASDRVNKTMVALTLVPWRPWSSYQITSTTSSFPRHRNRLGRHFAGGHDDHRSECCGADGGVRTPRSAKRACGRRYASRSCWYW